MAELTSATLACRRVIVAALLADPVVAGTVGGRIYRGAAPLIDGATGQAPAYPYITVAYLSMVPARAVGGGMAAAAPLFLVLLVGATEAQQEACVAAMITALSPDDPEARLTPLGSALGVTVSVGENEGDWADEPTLPGGEIVSRSGARLRFFCQNAA